jgi:hypothetical protein
MEEVKACDILSMENYICDGTCSPVGLRIVGLHGVCPSNLMFPVSRRELTPVA